LVHVSELANEGDDWQSHYEAGKRIRAEITHINSHDRRISLSEKGALERGDGEDVRTPPRRASSPASSLGDVMGDIGKKLRKSAASEDEAEAEAEAEEG